MNEDYQTKLMLTTAGLAEYAFVRGRVCSIPYEDESGLSFAINSRSPFKGVKLSRSSSVKIGDDVAMILALFTLVAHQPEGDPSVAPVKPPKYSLQERSYEDGIARDVEFLRISDHGIPQRYLNDGRPESRVPDQMIEKGKISLDTKILNEIFPLTVRFGDGLIL